MSHPSKSAGFTLTELLVTVLIVGILAAVAIPSFTAYINKSRVTEATTFLGEIKQREESYRSEFGIYVATPLNPGAAVIGGDNQLWAAPPAAWQQLGASPDGPVRFQYQAFAGAANAGAIGAAPGPAAGIVYPDPVNTWFYAQATGDLDADGTLCVAQIFDRSSTIQLINGAGTSLPGGWE